jgi:hypothetical protein
LLFLEVSAALPLKKKKKPQRSNNLEVVNSKLSIDTRTFEKSHEFSICKQKKDKAFGRLKRLTFQVKNQSQTGT